MRFKMYESSNFSASLAEKEVFQVSEEEIMENVFSLATELEIEAYEEAKGWALDFGFPLPKLNLSISGSSERAYFLEKAFNMISSPYNIGAWIIFW